MKDPLIFDIKRATTSDGPGLRTTVFLKGCNLDCAWCHNPEGKEPARQMAFFAAQCIGCGACVSVCMAGCEHCTACAACSEVCPTGARRRYGKHYTPEGLFEILSADALFYRATGGGVTFSGGECMLYPDYLAAVASLCQNAGITVAIDTAGCVPYENFETVLPDTDIFLYDIKCLDPELHRRGTGVDNVLILQNLERLRATGKQIIIRTPIIEGFHTEDEIERIKDYCAARDLPLELLPYHAFGTDKAKALASFFTART